MAAVAAAVAAAFSAAAAVALLATGRCILTVSSLYPYCIPPKRGVCGVLRRQKVVCGGGGGGGEWWWWRVAEAEGGGGGGWKCEYIKMVGAPPPRPPVYRFGSSAPSFGGFGTGSSNMVKPLDPKRFHIYRENRDEPL